MVAGSCKDCQEEDTHTGRKCGIGASRWALDPQESSVCGRVFHLGQPGVSVCPECQILDPLPSTLGEDLCAMPDASRNCRNVQRGGDDVAHHESSAPEYLFEIRGAAARSPPHKAHRCRGRMARISRSDPLPRRAGASPASHAPTRPHFAAPLCQNLICSLRPSV